MNGRPDMVWQQTDLMGWYIGLTMEATLTRHSLHGTAEVSFHDSSRRVVLTQLNDDVNSDLALLSMQPFVNHERVMQATAAPVILPDASRSCRSIRTGLWIWTATAGAAITAAAGLLPMPTRGGIRWTCAARRTRWRLPMPTGRSALSCLADNTGCGRRTNTSRYARFDFERISLA